MHPRFPINGPYAVQENQTLLEYVPHGKIKPVKEDGSKLSDIIRMCLTQWHRRDTT